MAEFEDNQLFYLKGTKLELSKKAEIEKTSSASISAASAASSSSSSTSSTSTSANERHHQNHEEYQILSARSSTPHTLIMPRTSANNVLSSIPEHVRPVKEDMPPTMVMMDKPSSTSENVQNKKTQLNMSKSDPYLTMDEENNDNEIENLYKSKSATDTYKPCRMYTRTNLLLIRNEMESSKKETLLSGMTALHCEDRMRRFNIWKVPAEQSTPTTFNGHFSNRINNNNVNNYPQRPRAEMNSGFYKRKNFTITINDSQPPKAEFKIKTKELEKNEQQTQMQRDKENTKNPQDKKPEENETFNLESENAKLRKEVEYLNKKCRNLEDTNSLHSKIIEDYEDKLKVKSNLLRNYEEKSKAQNNMILEQQAKIQLWKNSEKDFRDQLKVKSNLLRNYEEKSKAQNNMILEQQAKIQLWKNSEKDFRDLSSRLQSRLQIAYCEIETLNTKKAVCKNNGRNMSFGAVVWRMTCQIAAIQLMSVIFNAMRPN